ncbi:hypothetical protein BH11MYX4_BH11MYX4_36860 [soil metagenome]
MKHLVPDDRGLGTAYERYCFYQLLDAWAASFGVETFLEGPVDGMAGVAGVHGVGLARRGVKVVSAVPTEEHARVARAIYASCDAPAQVIVSGEDELDKLPRSDMVVCYHALSFVDDWRGYLQRVAALAKKVLIVTVCNPDNWGVAIVRSLGRMRGIQGVEAPESWQTNVLAPELWKYGRVREHTYFDCPWWPDLQVSPGQSLTDRLKRLVAVKKKFNFTDTREESKVADKYVYDEKQWPYFGGPGWADELLPGLLKHPSFEGASKKVRARAAHLHGFVVDMRPRTPRERRRLTQLESEKPG